MLSAHLAPTFFHTSIVFHGGSIVYEDLLVQGSRWVIDLCLVSADLCFG